MVRTCVYEGCKSSTGLHSFPADPPQARQWLQMAGRCQDCNTANMYVCNAHFSRESFVNIVEVEMGFLSASRLRLTPAAVPNPAKHLAHCTTIHVTLEVACQTDLSSYPLKKDAECQTCPVTMQHATVQVHLKPLRSLPPGVLTMTVVKEEVQEENSFLKEKETFIKKEEEEMDITNFLFSSVPVKSEDDEEKPQSPQLRLSLPQENRDSVRKGDCCEPEPHLEPGDKSQESSETDVSDGDWEENTEALVDLNSVATEAETVCRDGEKPFRCFECGRRFSLRENLNKHLKTHTGEEPFSCSECRGTSGHDTNLKTHMKIHTSVRPFSCSSCNKQFAWCHHLKTHQCVSVDGGESRPARKPNPDLGVGETTYDDDDKHFSCPDCGQSFDNKATFTNHLRTHSGEKPISCSVCAKQFSHRVTLRQHLRIHTGEKPFSCSQCGKKFNRSTNLRAHFKIHTGEKRFSCSFCHKKFTRKHHMQDHQRVCRSADRRRLKTARNRVLMPRPQGSGLLVLYKGIGLASTLAGTQQPTPESQHPT